MGKCKQHVRYNCRECWPDMFCEHLNKNKLKRKKSQCGFCSPLTYCKHHIQKKNSNCVICYSDTARVNGRNKNWYSSYRLRPEHVDQILASQDNRCPLCSVELTITPSNNNTNIEHLPGTGRGTDGGPAKVRGITCGPCNQFIREYEKYRKIGFPGLWKDMDKPFLNNYCDQYIFCDGVFNN